jgi:hypothetical protein
MYHHGTRFVQRGRGGDDGTVLDERSVAGVGSFEQAAGPLGSLTWPRFTLIQASGAEGLSLHYL